MTVANAQGYGPIKCSHGLVVGTDEGLKDIPAAKSFGAVIIPGGHRLSSTFKSSQDVERILKDHETCHRVVAAIGPSVRILKDHGIGKGRRITCETSEISQFDSAQYSLVSGPVVCDNRLITAQSTSNITEFTISIIRCLVGKKLASEMAEKLLTVTSIPVVGPGSIEAGKIK